MHLCIFRFKEIDSETGTETTQRFSDTKKEVYPVQIIPENKDGIQGSCALFKERKDVTKQVRSKSVTPLVSLEEALKRFVGFVYILLNKVRKRVWGKQHKESPHVLIF